MPYVLAQISDDWNVYEMVNEVYVIQAIEWIKSAWKEVSKDSIKNCLAKCGVVEQPANIDGDKDVDENLTMSPKNYLRSCKSMVTSLQTNTLISITRFAHYFHS